MKRLEIAEDANRTVDSEGFEAALREQSKRSKDARKDMTVKTTDSTEFYKTIFDTNGETIFLGRETYETSDSHVIGIVNASGEILESASAGKKVNILLNKTPFYAESGGQVGDSGTISANGIDIDVKDCQYTRKNIYSCV